MTGDTTQEAAKDLGYKKNDFPNAEYFSKTMLSLPIYPELSNEEINYVSRKINEFFI